MERHSPQPGAGPHDSPTARYLRSSAQIKGDLVRGLGYGFADVGIVLNVIDTGERFEETPAMDVIAALYVSGVSIDTLRESLLSTVLPG